MKYERTRFAMKTALIIMICLLLPKTIIAAQENSIADILMIPRKNAPKIDGKLDESVWKEAVPIGSLQMVEPDEGGIPTEKTEVYILATPDALYFGFVCYDRSPDRITSFTMQRDARLRGEDHIKIVLDTFGDGRTGYIFAVNPNGARYDALVDRAGEGENVEWDGIWEANTRRSEEGWSVEFYIPIKTMRFRVGLDQWGFNVERRIQRNQETNRWASPSLNYKVTHVSQSGQLRGIPDFQQGWGLTVRPYTQVNRTHQVGEGDPEYGFRPGLDIMKNFGGNITGLVSVNTDFAETEVDARRVNLTRFPLFFPEKRTFFLEGSDIFDFGLGMGFHHSRDIVPFFSRRIGLVEEQTIPLDLSVKATGSIGRFNFGVLNTVTRDVEGVAPRANLFAARGYQNVGKESKLGFLVTAGDPLGGKNNWLAGLDYTYKTSLLGGDKNLLVGAWGLVNQKPELGNDRTAFGFKVDYPNDLWDVSLTYKRLGRDFDPAMGFVPWKGIQKVDIGAIYKPRPEWSWLRQMIHELFINWVWDIDGTLYQYRYFTAPINWQLESGDRVEFNWVPSMEYLPESFELSPGVDVQEGTYRWTRCRLEFQSASKRSITTKATWWFGSFYDGKMDQIQVMLSWRPSHHLNIAVEGDINHGRMPSGISDIKLVRTRFDVYFTPNFQILSMLQYDNLTSSLGLNTRLRWTYRSLLDVFFVYNRNWIDTGGCFFRDLNQIFLKVQYAWRR